jgi:DNA replication protein DnaC
LLPKNRPAINLWNGEFDWTDNERARSIIHRFVYALPTPKRGLYIYGGAGTGKTTLAVALGNAYNDARFTEREIRYNEADIDKKLRYFAEDYTRGEVVYYDYVNAFAWPNVCALYRVPAQDRTEPENVQVCRLENASSARFWIFDDFASGHMTPAVLDGIERIIRGLYNNEATVIITSNVEMDKTRDIWSEPIRSRLVEMCFPVELAGKDRRGC